MVLRSRTARKARIEIIPMIDVVFFLLVFFMMATLAMTIYEGMPVNLPQAASRDRMAAETASITLDRAGQTFLNHEPIALGALGGRLKPLLAANRDLAVVVSADRDVTHARVVDVLDELRQTGVVRIAIAVAPGDPGRAAASSPAPPSR
jgi:biopolymer transport protein ExbD